VATPFASPEPANHTRWCFPDSEDGILAALEAGTTHLWANTILFETHPLQSSERVQEYQDQVNVVGQPPCLVQLYDDKDYVNNLLRRTGGYTMPKAWTITEESSLDLKTLPYPVVAKPVRGRGSFGVKVCHSQAGLRDHLKDLFADSPTVMLEEYLAGEEATITVMPPSNENTDYWSLPIVTRFNHADGIAPYNGVVAVTSNSRVISQQEYDHDPAYSAAARECEAVARLLRLTAPIRVDIRRREDKVGSLFVLFDVNMKPVSAIG